MTTETSLRNVPVREAMTRHVEAVTPDDRIIDVAQLMAEHRISTIPVINGRNECIGMISRSDLTEMFLEEDQVPTGLLDADRLSIEWLTRDVESGSDRIVSEMMEDNVVSINESEDLVTACQLMEKHQVHHLPVVNAENELVGILSTYDIVRWIAKSE